MYGKRVIGGEVMVGGSEIFSNFTLKLSICLLVIVISNVWSSWYKTVLVVSKDKTSLNKYNIDCPKSFNECESVTVASAFQFNPSVEAIDDVTSIP